MRFDKDSSYYKIIYEWIAQGVPFGDPAKDSVAAIEVEPKEIAMPKPGETAQVKVVARFQDGQSRDVTKEATVESNTPDVVKVDAPRKQPESAWAKPRLWFATKASFRPYRSQF